MRLEKNITKKTKNKKMIYNTSKEYLEKIIIELCKIGEDKEELSMWIDLYDALSGEERVTLIGNLEKELKDLKNLNQN